MPAKKKLSCRRPKAKRVFSITGLSVDKPVMMLMGDSLAQGCRSLSVTSEFCSQCYGSIVAQALHTTLATPDYPKPVIWDLESILSDLDIVTALGQLPGILDDIYDNIRFWAGSDWASRTIYHDNVAITGSDLPDVISYDSNYYSELIESTWERLLPNLTGSVAGKNIVDLFIAIAGRYALNPSNSPQYANMTQLKWVDWRKPKYLFVEIGHNSSDSGFFGSASSGYPITQGFEPVSDGFCKERYAQNICYLIDQLLQLDAGAPEKIYFGLLPKMSAVANLEPQGQPMGSSYFEYYVPALNFNKNKFTGDQMCAADAAVLWANQQIAAHVAGKDTSGRMELIDTYALFSKYDYKHGRYGLGRGQPIWIDNLQVTNEYIAGTPVPTEHRGIYKFIFNRGGFEGIDGCHPSAVGYAAYAIELLNKMGLSGAIDADQQLRSAVKNEWLLRAALGNNPPTDPALARIDLLRHLTNLFTGYTAEHVQRSPMAQLLISSQMVGSGSSSTRFSPRFQVS